VSARRALPRAPRAPVTRSAPGKVLLFGEHAVVYGQPAVGLPIRGRAEVTLAPGSGRVQLALAPGLSVEPSAAAAAPEALVARALGPLFAEVDTTLTLGFLPMAGFGSSAALGVALLEARDAYLGRRPPRGLLPRLEAAMAVETVAHARPSGVDPAIVLSGRPIVFERRDGRPRVRPLALTAPVALVIGAAGRHGGTARTVSRVADLKGTAPALVQAAMAALGAAARTGARALSRHDLALAGHALDLSHGVLSGLALVSEQVEAAVRRARSEGALGAKMSGAGGAGGAFVALFASAAAATRAAAALEQDGLTAWVEQLGPAR
jgi:mevalonate kinase